MAYEAGSYDTLLPQVDVVVASMQPGRVLYELAAELELASGELLTPAKVAQRLASAGGQKPRWQSYEKWIMQ